MENELAPIARLASSLGRKDEVLNQELAVALAQSQDTDAIQVLVNHLKHKEKVIQQDCIKVLYEIGAIKAALIAPYYPDFLELISSKNNRLQWGGMMAISHIATTNGRVVFADLPKLITIAEKGSVITRDQLVQTLIHLAGNSEYAKSAATLLFEQLLGCPTNQLPMYAERAFALLKKQDNNKLLQVLNSRLSEVEKESKRKRIAKLIRKLQ